jgi:hypothetical protein
VSSFFIRLLPELGAKHMAVFPLKAQLITYYPYGLRLFFQAYDHMKREH